MKLLQALSCRVNDYIVIDMKRSEITNRRKLGRPLSFEREAALQQAMLLFWRHGYEATSLSDLTAAMGVTPPSIYAAFGDKKRLFLEAVDRYVSGPVTALSVIKDAKTARDAAWGLLQGSAVQFTGSDTPSGCLLATSAISCSSDAADVQSELAKIRLRIEAHLKARILNAVETDELPPETDADALAGLIMSAIQGMSTLARDGATREKLIRVATQVMLAWPKSGRAHGSKRGLYAR
jgi:AcrR family transcriptional regulator